MATTTTNFGWDIPQSTDLVKDGATAIAALGQDIDTALVDLKGGTTGQVLAKASGTDLDFSWVAQDDSNAIQNAIVDAKGDLIAATAADTPARLAVGTNGYVLTADSAEATGLKWAAASAGAVTLIARTAFSGVASQAFDSVFTSTYKSYMILVEKIYSGAPGDDLQMQFRVGGTTLTSNYYAASSSTNYAGSTQIISNSNDSFMSLAPTIGSSTGPQTCTIWVNCVGNTNEKPTVRGNAYGINGDQQSVFGGSHGSSSNTVTGFLLKSESGSNITGTVAIYGLATA
jgi:hypothetical protein